MKGGMPPRDAFWREASVSRFFEEAFGASVHTATVAGDEDVVAITPSGLRLDYSVRTAEWLTEVTQRPHDYLLVFDYLYELLSVRTQHPLGRVCGGLAGLLCTLVEAGGDDGAGAPESEPEACRHGVACMQLAISKSVAVVLEVGR
eukprot:1178183-Prymnesium_polylepis.2